MEQVTNDDFEEKRVFVGTILHMSHSVEDELKEPASIRLPIALQQDQNELPNLPSSHIRVFHRTGRSQEWVEITGQLKPPVKLKNGFVTFQVNNIST